jgi:hypothetical protein
MPAHLNPDKTYLIDFACSRLGMRSFYAVEKYPIERAVLIDIEMTDAVARRKEH